jgi:CRISPR-associated protein Csm3
MFRKLENRAIIHYRIVTRSDLHVGGHTTVEPAEVDNPVIKNHEGFPIIPGSSLKGVLRTEMERLLRGLNTVNVCDIFDNKVRGGCNVCPVCHLFGGKDLASSIRIKDAVANSKKTLVRDGVAIDRQKRKARDRSKYDLEVVPKGTEFTGIATIENTVLKEIYVKAKLGAFLSLVDFFNACSGSIGHAISRGLGEVEIYVDQVNLITAEDYLESRYDGAKYVNGTDEFADCRDSSTVDWSHVIKSGEYE